MHAEFKRLRKHIILVFTILHSETLNWKGCYLHHHMEKPKRGLSSTQEKRASSWERGSNSSPTCHLLVFSTHLTLHIFSYNPNNKEEEWKKKKQNEQEWITKRPEFVFLTLQTMWVFGFSKDCWVEGMKFTQLSKSMASSSLFLVWYLFESFR